MPLREGWDWFTPDGRNTISLTRFVDGLEKLRGGNGMGAPPVRIRREPIPGMAGARTLDVRHDVNEVSLPLIAKGGTRLELIDVLERLAVLTDATLGAGVLRHTRLDGSVRELTCRCVGPMTAGPNGDRGPVVQSFELVFQADDPYWYGDMMTKGFTGEAPPQWFPILPLRLGASIVLGDVTITNAGQVPAFPVWTIIGPGDAPRLENRSTGEALEMENVSLEPNERVVIDTRPYRKSVIGPDGSNWFRYLTSRQMWSLAPGTSNVSLNLVGADERSYVAIAYREGFLTP